MVEGRDHLSFTHKSPPHFLRAQDLGSRQLQRNGPAQDPVIGAEDDPVPSPTDLVEDLEPPDLKGGKSHITGVVDAGKREGSSIAAVAL
jgi:hypothetical protein